MSTCMYCHREAVIYRPYSGEKLCKKCFTESLEKKVRKTISRYKMLQPDSRIAIAVSGGKDSMALLYILNKIEQKYPESELVVITVDEGILGYREDALRIIKKATKKLGVEWRMSSFKELFSYTLDELVSIAQEKFGEKRLKACTYCGVLRRKAINMLARQVGADVVATAHNLDDETQTILMNILRGDIVRFLRNRPRKKLTIEGLVPRVKPFKEIPEEEIALYVHFNQIDHHQTPCPYHQEAYREDVRNFLNRLERDHPGTKYSILRIYTKILEKIPEEEAYLKTCIRCGEPSSEEICKTCQLLGELLGESS
ncbi:MAG: TIGR00269 family protein [Candidatus Freyarchaeota archaeon]